jgi:TolB protein
LAFSRSYEGPSRIWLKSVHEIGMKPLVETTSDDRWPTWSASGDRLFFHRLVEDGAAVKIYDRETRQVRTIVEAGEKPLQASFDPHTQRIVYCAEIQGKQVLRILHLVTDAVWTLETGPGEACFPRWSPDGSKIAFVAKEEERWEISTINIDGTQYRSWTRTAPRLRGMYGPIDWSPDSTRIVFHADTEPFEADLYILDIRSGEVRNVTNDAWFDEAPSWTPDGRGIVFMSTRGGSWTWGLFRLSLDEMTIDAVASPDYTAKNFPRLSQDGWTVWSMQDDAGVEHLAEKSPVGQITILTHAGPWALWPSFSADGRFILFTTVHRRVEYWLAENLYSEGSPLLQQEGFTKESPLSAPYHDTKRNEPHSSSSLLPDSRSSPIDLHGR